MEDYLSQFRPTDPPTGFAERVLAPAKARLEQPLTLRLWSSRRFWAVAAASLLVLVSINGGLNSTKAPPRDIPPANHVELARELASALGGGSRLEARIRQQLSHRPGGQDETKINALSPWENELWPG